MSHWLLFAACPGLLCTCQHRAVMGWKLGHGYCSQVNGDPVRQMHQLLPTSARPYPPNIRASPALSLGKVAMQWPDLGGKGF